MIPLGAAFNHIKAVSLQARIVIIIDAHLQVQLRVHPEHFLPSHPASHHVTAAPTASSLARRLCSLAMGRHDNLRIALTRDARRNRAAPSALSQRTLPGQQSRRLHQDPCPSRCSCTSPCPRSMPRPLLGSAAGLPLVTLSRDVEWNISVLACIGQRPHCSTIEHERWPAHRTSHHFHKHPRCGRHPIPLLFKHCRCQRALFSSAARTCGSASWSHKASCLHVLTSTSCSGASTCQWVCHSCL